MEEVENNHLAETRKALEREELFQKERRKLEEEKNQWKGGYKFTKGPENKKFSEKFFPSQSFYKIYKSFIMQLPQFPYDFTCVSSNKF